MKNSIFIVALLAVFTFTSCKENAADKVKEESVEVVAQGEMDSEAFAQGETDTPEVPGKFPVMTFDKTEHDFGNITQGTKVEHKFTFTNTGEVPLVLSNASAPCGCTVPSFTREPIAPGDKGEMFVTFDGSGQGPRTNAVTVTANTEKGSERVIVKAFVEPNA